MLAEKPASSRSPAWRPVAGLTLWIWIAIATAATAAETGAPYPLAAGQYERAEVLVDGRVVLSVRGVEAFPAQQRAEEIARRIVTAAKDPAIPAGAVRTEDKGDRTDLHAGDRFLFNLFDADAELEGISRKILAEATQLRLIEAIASYRHDRSPRVLLINSLYALAAILAAVGLLFGFHRSFHHLDDIVARRLQIHLKALEAQSARFLRAQQLANASRGALKVIFVLLKAALAFLSLNFVLGLYPWTRPFAAWLFDLILDPIHAMALAVLATIPDLIFIALLILVTRYILKMIETFFSSIDQGAIRLASFEREWAWPTYRIARLLVIIFAVVMAYPYVPGSQSDAFKGISIFLGLIISLGSSSIIANIIAGYSLAYRRPFKIGDRVKINGIVGDVMEMRVLVARLRSPKNEEIVLPSTTILNGEVINYSTFAREQGLVLHTTVGIGYETPWRQVEAMLRMAADRTVGLLKQPPPFVLQTALGDFAVTYELNAYCKDPQAMARLYSVLHQNILDVFNEYGVAIMTPAYISDPPEPKLVPKDQWYAAPATTPAQGTPSGPANPA
ncbi:MAG: mechanosensitive ion channel [Candidatus Competibacter sp.]|nr:mechanosensitive ion channel [Candidatus Competibacter sp.]MDG4584982.1 mechanosensitive ion channel [Candidatus Competibacter sp.]